MSALNPGVPADVGGVESERNMKVDFKKLDAYKARSGQFRVVDVPAQRYLMIDGHGDPNVSAQYADALGALYPVAYTLKFASKRELERDYVVMPLEALWWAADMASFTDNRDKSKWNWTAMIMVPEWTDSDAFAAAVDAVERKSRPADLERVRLDVLDEGLCVQTLHIGPYDEEGPVLATLHHEYIPAAGLQMTGKHHEIYLNDPRRVAPSKLRTILRQPVTQL